MNQIFIKPAGKREIEELNAELPTSILNFHETKISEQESGNSMWLIAKRSGKAIGHLQIRFDGKDKIRSELKKN
jgi:hypothetical protein